MKFYFSFEIFKYPGLNKPNKNQNGGKLKKECKLVKINIPSN